MTEFKAPFTTTNQKIKGKRDEKPIKLMYLFVNMHTFAFPVYNTLICAIDSIF